LGKAALTAICISGVRHSVPIGTIVLQQVGTHPTHVFSYKGTPITQVSTKAWYAALERAGIDNFRWHDLRPTWASWHVQNGTPLFALQELGGWESAEMVRCYARLAAEHLAPYAERLVTLSAAADERHGTQCHSPQTERACIAASPGLIGCGGKI
jgi:integrase